jgi:hypothetical protein
MVLLLLQRICSKRARDAVQSLDCDPEEQQTSSLRGCLHDRLEVGTKSESFKGLPRLARCTPLDHRDRLLPHL